MKFLLAAMNAKYIHSNLGIYCLKAYGEKWREQRGNEGEDFVPWNIEIGEYTINHQMDDILRDIYRRKPDAVGLSCYIWNLSYVMNLVRDLPKILPDTEIWLGGPEVSYNAETLLREEPGIKGIMMGEGEDTFLQIINVYEHVKPEERPKAFSAIEGLAVRGAEGEICVRPLSKAVDMNRIPFPYTDLEQLENRIIYYESSRGCPFSCSYCLSSLDKSVRYRDLELVKKELEFFLEKKVPQVKFVDRTFNCSRSRTLEIWTYLRDHDNGVTNFHFEISADLLNQEEIELIKTMRPGLIQLEIGVQSTNENTIKEIRRTTDLQKLSQAVDQINALGNVHQHLDLIAGLPWEGYESFQNSFNQVFAMKPKQLQLGFLKVLKGSYMEEMAVEYGLKYQCQPPYEVLGTKWIDYGEILKLKAVEEMVEVYYNSGKFEKTMEELQRDSRTPFDLFYELSLFYEKQGLKGKSHSRMARYEILYDFIRENFPYKKEVYGDLLVFDLYWRENLKSRPAFARDQSLYRNRVRKFFQAEQEERRYLKEGYDGCTAVQMMRMAHLEVFGQGRAVLFDYKNRDPLTYNGRAYEIGSWQEQ